MSTLFRLIDEYFGYLAVVAFIFGVTGCAIKSINKNCVQTQDEKFWVCDAYPWTR